VDFFTTYVSSALQEIRTQSMTWQYNILTLPMLIASAIALVLAFFVWRRRPQPGALALAVLLVAIAGWSLAYALVWGSPDPGAQFFWTRIQYLGVVTVPAAWLVFVLEYTGQVRRLAFRWLALLAIEPLAILFAIWTNERHGLMTSNIGMELVGTVSIMVWDYGPLFWANVGYSYLLFLAGTVLLILSLVPLTRLYRGQLAILLAGVLVLWLGSFLFLVELSPIPHYDLTPLTFTFTGIAMAYGLYHFHLLDIVPVARAAIFDHVADGIIVLDFRLRIVEINPAAQEILDCPADQAIGQPIGHFMPALGPSIQPIARMPVEVAGDRRLAGPTAGESCGRHNTHGEDERCCFEIDVTTLNGHHGRLNGWLLVLHDVSQRWRVEETLRRQLVELTVLHAVATVAAETADEAQLLPMLANIAGRILSPDCFAIWLKDRSRNTIELRAVSSGLHGYDPSAHRKLVENAVATGTLQRHSRLTNQEHQVAPVPALLCAPIEMEDTAAGAIIWSRSESTSFSPADEHLLTILAQQVATAIGKTRLLANLERRAQQLATLNDLANTMTGLLAYPQLCDTVVQSLISSLGYASVALFSVNRATDREVILQSVAGPYAALSQPGEYRQAFGHGLIGQAAETQQVLLVNDTLQSPEFFQLPGMDVRSELAIPLRAGSRLVGVLAVNSQDANAFDDNDVATLATVGDQLAVAMETARLFEETRRRTQELEILDELSVALRQAENVENMLQIALDHCMAALHSQRGAISLPGPEPDTLTIVHERGWPTPLGQFVYHKDHSIVGHVFQSRHPYLTSNVVADPRAHSEGAATLRMLEGEPQAAIYAPLQAEGEVVGVISVCSLPGGHFGDDDLRLLAVMAEIAGSALQRAHLLETLEHRVTERTQELAQANARLQELDRLKSEFISNVSHELRTPLTNIKLYLNLLVQGREERRAKYVEMLQDATHSLHQLVETILDLSRLDAVQKQGNLQFGATDLERIARVVVENHQPQADAMQVTLAYSGPEQPVEVRGEPNQLIQVVTNLVVNAIHYTPSGGQIWVSLDQHLDEVRLQVRDTGIGISCAEKDQLFERFFRSERVTALGIPGTGLGLSIVQEIVKLHGGHIEVESQPDQGSTFQVRLPALVQSS
jgi:signal transduction histidine kinase/putative methionine-R-sulfoxide reductase with GAF domain/PAS domain-containing protein